MYNLLEYGLGKMLIGIGTFGDYLADFTFDTLEEEPKLEYDEFENNKKEENELKPYKEKIKYLTKFDKYFSHEVKSKGIKYYILDKIKSYNFNDNIISGVIHENNDQFISIEIQSDNKILNSSCTCDVYHCEHIYSLLLKYSDEELNNKIYYMFKTKYLLTQFQNLYNKIIINKNINLNEDLYKRINCYEKLINNYMEKEPTYDLYKEIEGNFNGLKDILFKIDKDLFNKIIIDIEFIDYDICSDIYHELVSDEYIEDFIIDKID